MDVLLDSQRYDQLYNCSNFNVDLIPIESRAKVLQGTVLLILFFIFECLQAHCTFALYCCMGQQHTAYKMLFFIGIADMASLVGTGLIAGIIAINGILFCSAPLFIYSMGMLLMFTWAFGTTLQVLLAAGRCIDQIVPKIERKLFDGKRLYIWLFAIFVYSIYYGFFTMPIVFTSVGFMWAYDPFLGHHGNSNNIDAENQWDERFINQLDQAHILIMAIALPAFYLTFLCCLSLKWRAAIDESESLQQMRKQVFSQVFVISVLAFVYCLHSILCVQLASVPNSFLMLGNYLYVLLNGMPALVYLTMNRSIRLRVIQLYKRPQNSSVRIAWT